MINFPLLSLVIFTPLIGVLSLLLFSGTPEKSNDQYRFVGLSFSILTFILSLLLVFNFDQLNPNFQFEEKLAWINRFNINYHIGIDAISLSFILLTTFLMPLCILASWKNTSIRVKEFLIYFLLLESAMIGVFSGLDLILFYIFFEATLIPMFLIIGIWGGKNRIYAAYKFFLYTLAGSLPLLLAIIYIYIQTNSFDLNVIITSTQKFDLTLQKYLWICFFLSFAIKVPMFPFHTWLPDAHVEAPTSGSIILAGILIKMGAYGFIRFSLPLFPDASNYFKEVIYILSIIAVIYASLIAFMQKDIKKLIAYSSVAHMGFVTAGIFSMTKEGLTGAVIQMISHGIVSGGLFFSVGVIYDCMHTREISEYGGIVEKMPKYALFFMLLTMAAVALPGTSGFTGEFLILIGVFRDNILVSMGLITGMVLGALYMLFLYKKSIFGESNSKTLALTDLTIREVTIYLLLTTLILFIGIYPKFIVKFLELPVENLLNQINYK